MTAFFFSRVPLPLGRYSIHVFKYRQTSLRDVFPNVCMCDDFVRRMCRVLAAGRSKRAGVEANLRSTKWRDYLSDSL
jgi:hypothetical protein